MVMERLEKFTPIEAKSVYEEMEGDQDDENEDIEDDAYSNGEDGLINLEDYIKGH